MANGLKKSTDEAINTPEENISEEVLAEVVKAKSKKDAFATPKLKEEDTVTTPGHTRRDFRN
jgi:hypothetical protein